MKLLITGSEGLLGRTLMRRLGSHDPIGASHDWCDVACAESVERAVHDTRPDCVIHAAAFTAVDDCEGQPDRAYAVNALGSGNVAAACGRAGVRLIAISTDYVFSGELGEPYDEWATPDPKTVYGQSKLAGEKLIRELCPDHLIARTAWLYGPGGPSFVHTMLRLGSADDDAPLRVVNDQIGQPTSTAAVADALAALLDVPLAGTVHLTCGGRASWYDLAREVFRLGKLPRPLEPCTTAEMPRPAPRPADSRLEGRVLRLAGLDPLPDWQDALERFFREHPHG